MKTIEVELRALLSEEQYHSFVKHFSSLAPGEVDNAETYTFLTPNYNIKVKNLTSKKKAKITVKKGAEYQQHVDETELSIDPAYVKDAVNLITALGFEKHIPSRQQRINFAIDDITVSLKHETHWKHHIEAEIVVSDEHELPKAKARLERFFAELGIKPMTEEENKALVNSVTEKLGLGKV